MSVVILYYEFLFVRFVVLSLYITRGGSFQINVPFSAVTVTCNEMTVKPAPDFFQPRAPNQMKLRASLFSEQADGGQRKCWCQANAKTLPEKAWGQEHSILRELSRVSCATGKERVRKPHPFLQDPNASTESQTERFWLLSHSQGQGNTRSLASSRRLCN